jgi:hypothetical protein
MAEDGGYPTFDEKDRSIFAIKESRLRADTMKDAIVPKLREIARAAFAVIEDVYKVDPLSTSSESLSPEHRDAATKTKPFDEAAAGLVMRQIRGKYHYLKLRFHLSDSGLVPFMEASRPVESEALLGVLRDYKDKVLQTFEYFDINIWTHEKHDPKFSNEDLIESIRVDKKKNAWQSGLIGSLAEYPIDSDEYVGRLVEQFVAMFPVYQATCERLAGIEDHFRDYFLHLDAWAGKNDGEDEDEDSGDVQDEDSGDVQVEDLGDSLNPEPSAIEGEIVQAMIQHRRREQRLREERIQQVKEATGRLRCEVPGCGFDFFEVYGEIGDGFAHVHHLQPLGDRSEPSQTRLSDLAIVCANCHAMIHRGGTVRPLEGLIRGQ